MLSLLAYGSLMHPRELARLAPGAPCTPVRVLGFQRTFCQEPSWRPATRGGRGVLTVRPAAGHWINAVRIDGLDADVVAALDHRERGYVRTTVAAARIECLAPRPGAPAGDAALYVGRDERFNADLLPNEEYLRLCVDGAAAWGESFLRDFLGSTFVGEGSTLLELRPELAPDRPSR